MSLNLEKIKERIKGYQLGIWFLFIFLVSIAILVYVSRFLSEGSFLVGANVNYADDNPQYFSVSWKKFLQIICLGPVFGILYYILMRITLSKVDKERHSKYIIYFLEILVVILIIANSMGHLSHLGFEVVNTIDRSEGKSLDSEYSEEFTFAWFMDEWLGHTMIHTTYFMYLVLAVIVELLIAKNERMKPDELFLVLCYAIGIGILNGQIAISSESGFVLLLFQLIFTIIALIVIAIKKINPRNYPILLAMLLATIFVVYFNIDHILREGFTNYYPYY